MRWSRSWRSRPHLGRRPLRDGLRRHLLLLQGLWRIRAAWDGCARRAKNTFEKLGIPQAEGEPAVGAHNRGRLPLLKKELEEQGVIFLDMDSGLREHEDIVEEYFGTIIPPDDNKFAALNSAVWSGGSFVYIPPGVSVDIPLQAYFRINAENMGQFERTLIIADEDSYVHYIEGCTAPTYTTNSLHSAVVELIAKPGRASATRPSRTGRTTPTTW